MVRAHPTVHPPKWIGKSRSPGYATSHAREWRAARKASGGHVTNLALSAQAWQAVQDRRADDRSTGSISRAASGLIEAGSLVDERVLGMAQEILDAYPDMGSIRVAIEVSVAHLIAKIRGDESYTISLPS